MTDRELTGAEAQDALSEAVSRVVGKRAAPHWSVSVYRNGSRVVTIETNHLSGRDLIDGDEEIIRTAARSLLGFIGEAHHE